MTSFEPNASVRTKILEALDMLINKTHVEEANKILEYLSQDLGGKKQVFSFDSLFSGSSIRLALDEEFQSQTTSLIQIRSEVSGEKPFWHTYAFKYDFTEFFSPEMEQAFKNLIEFLDLIEDASKRPEQRDHFENLHEHLYEFMHEVLKPTQVSDLLLGLLIHEAMLLPVFRPTEIRETFDVSDSDTSGGFSLIRSPNVMIESYARHTQYFRKLIRQITGQEIIYATIVISGPLSSINVR